MLKTQVKPFDTRDDRREVYHLLGRLPPRERIAWLEWACKGALIPKTRTRPHVSPKTYERAKLAYRDDSADVKLTTELFLDFWMCAANYSLDTDAALVELERRVRVFSRGR